MSLSPPMKWVLAVMREEGVTIRRSDPPGFQAPRGMGSFYFSPKPRSTRGKPSRDTVLALEHQGLIALERIRERTVYVLTEKGEAQ